MQKESKRANQTKSLVITLSILIATTACSTAKTRDARLAENMELQNAVIDAAKADRATPEVKAEVEKNETLKEAEAKLGKALDALKSANETVLAKMKPNKEKECEHEQDEGDDDGQ